MHPYHLFVSLFISWARVHVGPYLNMPMIAATCENASHVQTCVFWRWVFRVWLYTECECEYQPIFTLKLPWICILFEFNHCLDSGDVTVIKWLCISPKTMVMGVVGRLISLGILIDTSRNFMFISLIDSFQLIVILLFGLLYIFHLKMALILLICPVWDVPHQWLFLIFGG